MKKIKIIGIVVVLLAIIGLARHFKGQSGQQVSILDPKDTAVNFYDQWLKAVYEPTNPNLLSKDELAKSPLLSKELRTKIANALKDPKNKLDPVLCQSAVPGGGISTRSVYSDEKEVQILVTSKDKKVTEEGVVFLKKLNNGWYINDIECSPGEFAPEREFSFEKVGYLLKGSVPKPFDSKNWHLVFEDNGELGHIVPLFFSADTQCTSLDGAQSICKPEQFTETTKVSVHGQMSERGADIKKLEFVK